ncbi:MAG: SRPBCC domain-containing protein [Anaerolineales bacterium]|nr:SRPBCC domain-containing protein [Anaerolineales bacterium]
MEKQIKFEIKIPAPLSAVWGAWTTEAGARTFFAPKCRIELKPGGAYEMLFNLDAPPGEQGGEEMIVLAVQPEKMLSFTWNAPTNLPTVRGEMTHVVVYFEENTPEETLISLVHDGWGEGGEWDQAFDYFTRAWGGIVLPRLKYRFAEGPIDWENPPALGMREK